MHYLGRVVFHFEFLNQRANSERYNSGRKTSVAKQSTINTLKDAIYCLSFGEGRIH